MVEISPNRHMPDIKIDNIPSDVLPGNASERAEIHLKELIDLQSTPGIKIGHIEVMPEITNPTPSVVQAPTSQLTDEDISGLSEDEWNMRHSHKDTIKQVIHPKTLPSAPKFRLQEEPNPRDVEAYRLDQLHMRELQDAANATGKSTVYTCHDGTRVNIKPRAKDEDPLT